MITFKDFLAERIIVAAKVSELDIANAIKMLNTHCKNGLEAIANGGILFRGNKSYANIAFAVVDSRNSLRTSKDTNNVYQIMMDASLELADYPKRSKSLICSTDLDDASSYGSPFVVIPFDGTKIAFAPVDDLIYLETRSKLIGECEALDNLSKTVGDVMIEFCRASKQKNPAVDIDLYDVAISKDPEKFCDKWTFAFDLSKSDSKKLRNIVIGSKTPFTDLSSAIMTPKNLQLKLVEFGQQLPDHTECWFSGKCMIINPLIFSGILHALKQQKAKVSSDLVHQMGDYYDNDNITNIMNSDYIKNVVIGKSK